MYIFAELEAEAKDVFREYLNTTEYWNPERFFNEWQMTFQDDGPFETEEDLRILSEKMTKPDDFEVRNLQAMLRAAKVRLPNCFWNVKNQNKGIQRWSFCYICKSQEAYDD